MRGRNLMQARVEAVSMMCFATAMLKIRLDSSGTASDATSRLNLLYLTRLVTHDAQVRKHDADRLSVRWNRSMAAWWGQYQYQIRLCST